MKPDNFWIELLCGVALVVIPCVILYARSRGKRHLWGAWNNILASDLTIIGRTRRCLRCPAKQDEYYPEGH